MPSTSSSAVDLKADSAGGSDEKVYFVQADEANATFLGKPSWCALSERRLLNKLSLYKPVGAKKNFNLFALMHAMHFIVEDEDDTDFEEYLLPDDYQQYVERQKSQQKDVMIFPPKYRFRPNQQELLAKINEFYNVDLLSKYDLTVQPFGSANKEYSIPSQLSASGHHG